MRVGRARDEGGVFARRSRGAPHEGSGFGERRCRIREAEFDEVRALIDRRSRNRRGAREISEFRQNARIARKALRDDDGLFGIGLRVFIVEGQPATGDAASTADLIDCQIHSELPHPSVIGIIAAEWPRNAEHDVRRRFRPPLHERRER